MGLDAYLHFRATGDISEVLNNWPSGYGEIVKATPRPWELEEEHDYTHCVATCARWYGLGGGNGPGNVVVACLMALLRCPKVEKVWYGYAENKWMLQTKKDVLAIAMQWMDNADSHTAPDEK